MNTDAECRAAFDAAEAALRDTGDDARFILRNVAMADDRVRCIAGLYDKTTNERTEVIVEWTPDESQLLDRFRSALRAT